MVLAIDQYVSQMDRDILIRSISKSLSERDKLGYGHEDILASIQVVCELLYFQFRHTMQGENPMTDQDTYPPIKLLTGNDVARILKVSRGYAYRLMQQGVLPTLRIGRSVRVSYDHLYQFIQENTGTEKNEP
jgi:excisionase family DNA binding protein